MQVTSPVACGPLRGFVPTALGQIHYREAGHGPPLVLLHQTADSGAMFQAVMPLLAHAFRVIAPDTPGFGASERPAGQPCLADYVDALCAVCDRLGIARAHVLGHHSGASFALALAARHPARVDRLVLCGLPDFPAHEAAARVAALSPPTGGAGDCRDWAWQRICQRMQPWASQQAMDTSFVDTLAALPSIRHAYEAVYSFDVREYIPQVHAATLLLHGADEHFADSQRRLRPLFRHARVQALLDSGPCTMLQCPAAFAAAVAEFLAAASPSLLQETTE